MRRFKNHLLAGSGVVVLLGSSVLGVGSATRERPSKQVTPVQESATRLPASGTLARRAKVPAASVSHVALFDTSDDLEIEASLGDENITLERRKHRRPGTCCSGIVVISIIGVLVGKPSGDGGPPMIDLRATITGTDAVRGSLLYGLSWLAGDPDPLGAVRELGYDIDVSKEHDRPCAD